MNCFRKYLLFLVLLVFQFKFHSQTLKHYSSLLDRTDISGFESTRTFDKNGVILSKKKYHPLSVAVYGVLSYYNFKESNDSSYYFKSVNQPESKTVYAPLKSAEYKGEELSIGFNALYLKEAVAKYISEEIFFTFKDANSATLFLPKEDDQKTIILLMPVRINE